jgi:hypothetical protein
VKVVLGDWSSCALSGLFIQFAAGNKLIWFIIAVNIQKNGCVGERGGKIFQIDASIIKSLHPKLLPCCENKV